MTDIIVNSEEMARNLDVWFVVYDDTTNPGQHQKPKQGWGATSFKRLDGVVVMATVLPGYFESEEHAHAWVDARNAERGVRVVYPNPVKRFEGNP